MDLKTLHTYCIEKDKYVVNRWRNTAVLNDWKRIECDFDVEFFAYK